MPRDGKRRPRSKPRRAAHPTSWTLRILVTVLALLALPLAGLATVMLVASPGKHLRDKLIREVRQRTGRIIEVRGGISFIASRQPGIVLSQIVVPAPEGMAGPATLTAKGLRLDIAVAPLMRGRIVVEQASLIGPAIDLRIDGNGRRSWQIATQPRKQRRHRSDRRHPADPTASETRLLKAAVGARLQLLSRLDRTRFALHRLRIINGSIRYTNAQSGRKDAFDSLHLDFSGARLDAKLAVSGAVRWRDQRLSLKGQLETLPLLLANQPVKTELAISGGGAKAGFSGTLDLAHKLKAQGLVGFTTASLTDFLNWQGIGGPQAGPLGRLHANGYLSIADDTIKLDSGFVVLGTARTNGSLEVKLNGGRPAITADLKISHLDVDQLSRLFRTTKHASTALFQPDPGAPAQRSVDELLRGSRSSGGIARFSLRPNTIATGHGWPTNPIDSTAMRRLDINARLAIDNLGLGGLKFTQSNLSISLQDGALSADLKDALLYGGRVRSRLTARPAPKGIVVALNCFADGVSARALLGDIATTQTIEGATRLAAKVSGVGASQQQIMASLAGTAQVTLSKGAIAGWDAEAVLGELKRGRIPELKYMPSEKTEFRELSAAFAIDRGIANTRDVRLITKVATVAGEGDIDIGRRRLDLLTTTKPVASADDNQAQAAISGLALPIRIRGDWSKPSVTLELENAFRNPDKARKALRKARQRFKGRDPNEVVRGILRDGKKSDDLRAAKKVLKDLFR